VTGLHDRRSRGSRQHMEPPRCRRIERPGNRASMNIRSLLSFPTVRRWWACRRAAAPLAMVALAVAVVTPSPAAAPSEVAEGYQRVERFLRGLEGLEADFHQV